MSSVIVEFDPYTKTGNRLCQFAFGRILAIEKNVPFFSRPIPGFKKTFDWENSIPITPNIIKTLTFGAHYTDYKSLLSTDKTIVINSYLQKYKYYQPHLQFLKDLFQIDEKYKFDIDSSELVIHIRGTDYRHGNVHIEDEIYFDILNKLSPEKVSIVTDDIDINLIKKLCENKNVSLVTQNGITNKGNGFNEYELHDFAYMLNAKNLLISQSTFSWWAAFLGNQKNVYIPYIKTKNCMWNLNPGIDDIDLIPANEEKFKKLIYE